MADILQNTASAIQERLNKSFMPATYQRQGMFNQPVSVGNGGAPNDLASSGLFPGGGSTLPNNDNIIQISYTNTSLVREALFMGTFSSFLNPMLLQQIVTATSGLIAATSDLVIAGPEHNNLLQTAQSFGLLGVQLSNVTWSNPLVADPTSATEIIQKMTLTGTNTQPVINTFRPSGLVEPSSFNKNIINVMEKMVYNIGNESNFIITVRAGWTLEFNLMWNVIGGGARM